MRNRRHGKLAAKQKDTTFTSQGKHNVLTVLPSQEDILVTTQNMKFEITTCFLTHQAITFKTKHVRKILKECHIFLCLPIYQAEHFGFLHNALCTFALVNWCYPFNCQEENWKAIPPVIRMFSHFCAKCDVKRWGIILLSAFSDYHRCLCFSHICLPSILTTYSDQLKILWFPSNPLQLPLC